MAAPSLLLWLPVYRPEQHIARAGRGLPHSLVSRSPRRQQHCSPRRLNPMSCHNLKQVLVPRGRNPFLQKSLQSLTMSYGNDIQSRPQISRCRSFVISDFVSGTPTPSHPKHHALVDQRGYWSLQPRDHAFALF